MADKVLLSGTNIEIVQKYDTDRRLDFPDFSEVCKTTFGVGEIIDFEKVSDDPITVKSRVKVKGAWGESEYIPLVFKPKLNYWDDEFADPPVLATDFDEETGAFKTAWQSFRCTDEVVVMLSEGKPVAVLGHTDGVPRIGEDVFKMEMDESPDGYQLDPNPYYISAQIAQKTIDVGLDGESTYSYWAENPAFPGQYPEFIIPDEGPDGKDYGCVLEVPSSESGVDVTATYDGSDEAIEKYIYYPNYQRYGSPYEAYYRYHYFSRTKWYWKTCVWIPIVGPIVYIIYAMANKQDWYNKYYRADIRKEGHGVLGESGLYGPYPCDPDGTLPTGFTCLGDGWWNEEDFDIWHNYWHQDCTEQHSPGIQIIGYQTAEPTYKFKETTEAPYSGEYVDNGAYFYNDDVWMVKAGLYKEGIIEEIVSAVEGSSPLADYLSVWGGQIGKGWLEKDWGSAPEGFVKQQGFIYFMNWDARYIFTTPDMDFSTYVCPEDFHFFTRPHTKEELIAAGMWPATA